MRSGRRALQAIVDPRPLFRLRKLLDENHVALCCIERAQIHVKIVRISMRIVRRCNPRYARQQRLHGAAREHGHALAFRAARRKKFPASAAVLENKLEVTEGLESGQRVATTGAFEIFKLEEDVRDKVTVKVAPPKEEEEDPDET